MAGESLKVTEKPDHRGFTLIEVLVILSIAAFIGVIAFAFLNSSRKRARDADRSSDVQTLYNTAMAYFVEYGEYPLTQTSTHPANIGGATPPGVFDITTNSTLTAPVPAAGAYAWTDLGNALSSFLSRTPKDPKNIEGYYYIYTIFVDASGKPKTIYMTDPGFGGGLCGITGGAPVPGARAFRGYIRARFENIEPRETCLAINPNEKIVFLP